jgi:hypothetical protein
LGSFECLFIFSIQEIERPSFGSRQLNSELDRPSRNHNDQQPHSDRSRTPNEGGRTSNHAPQRQNISRGPRTGQQSAYVLS